MIVTDRNGKIILIVPEYELPENVLKTPAGSIERYEYIKHMKAIKGEAK